MTIMQLFGLWFLLFLDLACWHKAKTSCHKNIPQSSNIFTDSKSFIKLLVGADQSFRGTSDSPNPRLMGVQVFS